ncbi:hypothetical protein H0H87_000927 [Tephrocybe sp. NHM501043]|nr:hypothetical protein H0H87_000927 [Tephrocybe sp. NHM501043]
MYFPTIARQISDTSVKVERHVHDTVQETPSVADYMSSEQAAKLFIGAIAEASRLNPERPVLVVIDGLDETNHAYLYDTATIISQVFKGLSAYPNAKVMIASRTERDIHQPFTSALTNEHVKRLHLSTKESVAEVGIFLRNRLEKVAHKHHLDPTVWPGQDRQERLIDQADGLYIWAVTVTKFLDARLRKEGKTNPHGIIDQLRLPDKADINVLYQQILRVTYDEGEDDTTEWDLETFRRIIGAILVARKPLSVAELDDLLDLRYPVSNGSLSNHVDMLNFVNLLRTVLVSGMDTVHETTAIRLHKSFFEFATENSEMRFRVDLAASNAYMTLCCLKHIAKLYAVVASTQFASSSADVRNLPPATRYTLDYCLSHTPRNRQMLGIVLEHPDMTLSQFHAVLMSSSSNVLPLSIQVENNSSIINTSLHTHSLIWDYDSGSPTIPNNIPMETAVEVAVSPDGRYCGSGRSLIDLQTLKLLKQIERSLASSSASFSPDGSHCAIADGDGKITLWDTRTWSVKGSFSNAPEGDFNQIVQAPLSSLLPVVLSPDGSWILSSTVPDNALLIWDFVTGQQIGEPFIGHTAEVQSTAFSPNSQNIASCDVDHMVRLWDVKSRQQLGDPIYGFHSVCFSPDGSYVLLSTGVGFQLREIPTMRTLMMDDVKTFDDSFFTDGTITPDGQHAIITNSEFNTMSIFNISPLIFHIKNTLSLKWSAISIPKGNLFAYMDSDNTLFLSRLASNRFGGRALSRGNPNISVISVVFSSDERHIAGICADGLIHLWNAEDYTLVGTHQNPPSHGIPSLAFAPDGISIFVQTGSYKTLLTPKNNQLIESDDIWTVPDVSPPTLISDLSIKPHVYSNSRNSSLQSVRWFPTVFDEVLWAYVDNHIIRAGSNGGFVVIPVNLA